MLFIFLWNFRTSLISLTAIPFSILITALVFRYFGFSINTMTLGGLAVAIGELVDDSSVGHPLRCAFREPARAVRIPAVGCNVHEDPPRIADRGLRAPHQLLRRGWFARINRPNAAREEQQQARAEATGGGIGLGQHRRTETPSSYGETTGA